MLFQIETFERRSSTIIVTIVKDDVTTEKKVSRPKFEAYLDRVGALNAPIQMHDDEETCETVPCVMTLDEYYQQGDVHADLYTYILETQGNDVFGDALNAMKSIASEFRN